MKIRSRLFLPLLALVLAVSSIGCGGKGAAVEKTAPYTPAQSAAEEAPADRTGDADPAENRSPDIAFSTVDADGESWTDACFAESRLTMINLWAYWCGPCMAELPALQQLSERYADQGLQVLGLGFEEDEADDVAAAAEAGVTYPCLRYTDDFARYMDTGCIPTTLFVDSDGAVLDSAYIGSRSYDEWAQIVESYLDTAK